ncbi:MAG: helix-turn-helix domain-containing protein [Oscillospiraceae bacterium]|nr:helix-turn-helix domain-containing protein [Oscillospiraceae bacterium]
MQFRERLREERERLSLTQTELAEQLGVSRNTIVNYERGASHPRERRIYSKLAEIFGVDVNYFLTDDEVFLTEAEARYGRKGTLEAEELLEQAAALFAGGTLSETDQIAFLHDMQRLFLDSKDKARKKFTPKKYRDTSDD